MLGGARKENSAEHSWHVALMAVVLAEHAPAEVDLARVVRMLLVHDLVEIDAGDGGVLHGPGAKFSKRVNSLMKVSRMVPTGPLRCLPMMISATPWSSGAVSSLSYISAR